MLYSCQPSFQQKNENHIQGLQKYMQLLNESWVTHHNFPCRWRITPLQDMVYKNISGGPKLNITGSNEHVTDIEHQIRVVKERTRADRHILPFKNTLKFITIYIVFTVLRMLKYLPVKGGVSAIISPKDIMPGKSLHYKRHLGLNIGQYLQVHDNEYTSNSQLP